MKFQGFESPKENWSKLPHELINHLHLMTSEAEVKIVLYILRHTWGFGDDEKKITIDEFCNGRKRRDGSRLDNGIGLSINSVRDGIARAIEHGFIEMTEDATDKGRIKRYYHLRGSELDSQKLIPRGSEVDTHLSEVDTRTEKDTVREKLKEKQEEGDSSFAKICTAYQGEIGFISPIAADKLKELMTLYPPEWIVESFGIAATSNKRRLDYCEGILKRWKSDGKENRATSGGSLAGPNIKKINGKNTLVIG